MEEQDRKKEDKEREKKRNENAHKNENVTKSKEEQKHNFEKEFYERRKGGKKKKEELKNFTLFALHYSREQKLSKHTGELFGQLQMLSVNQSITLLKQTSRGAKPFGVCYAFIDWLMFAERTEAGAVHVLYNGYRLVAVKQWPLS